MINAVKHSLPGILTLLIGTLLGFFLKNVFLGFLIEKAQKTPAEIDDILLKTLRRHFIKIFFSFFLYIGLKTFPSALPSVLMLQKAALVLFLFILFLFISSLISEYIGSHRLKLQGSLPAISLVKNISQNIVILVGVLIIMQTLGISVTPVLTALGVGGLAVALALQDTLSNFFSGLHILATKKVRPGDYVQLETGQEGYVTDITWRNTAIRQLSNNVVIIPNNKLASAIVTNYCLPDKELAVLVQVGVSYESDLEKVEKTAMEVGTEVMREAEGGVKDFKPFIRYHTFGDFSVNFTVILRGREFVDKYLITHEFIKRLKKRFDREKITIPFPIRTV
ncbi:MAG TPA: mechanosensitive ion channel family protein, partial [bacterium]|nr:mechanosensitive ion channel family protein [bacterium]